jgi:hypothetical protein
MTIKHEFELTASEGKTAITISDWVKTLPQADQDRFGELDDARHASIVALKNENKMVTNPDGSYTWLDLVAEAEFSTKLDPEWVKYWHRYISENQLQFNLKRTEV